MQFEKNPDGTDKLDEQGNPIPVKVIDEKELEAAKEKENLVNEIKDLRVKLGVTEALLKDKAENPPVDPNRILTDEEKLELLLDKKLKEREALNAQANKTAAFERFIKENKEFSPENDPTGLKRDALQKKFNSFNTEGLSKIEEFLPIIGDAKRLLQSPDSQVDISKGNNPYPNPPTPRGMPPAKPDEVLSPKELKLVQITGKTKEQILKLKLKNPDYFRSLLDFVRD